MLTRSSGPPQLNRSSERSNDYANAFTGEHTSTHFDGKPVNRDLGYDVAGSGRPRGAAWGQRTLFEEALGPEEVHADSSREMPLPGTLIALFENDDG